MSGATKAGAVDAVVGAWFSLSVDAAETLKQFSDPTRLEILRRLRAAPDGLNVGDLITGLALPQPTISHHLGILRLGRAVTRAREGKSQRYRIDPDFHARARAVVEL